MCSNKGVCMTPEHIASELHVQRTDVKRGYCYTYTRELGSRIEEVWTHEDSIRAAEPDQPDTQDAGVPPALPCGPPGLPDPAAQGQLAGGAPGLVAMQPTLDAKIDAMQTTLDAKLDALQRTLDRLDVMQTAVDSKLERLETAAESLQTKVDAKLKGLGTAVDSWQTVVDAKLAAVTEKLDKIDGMFTGPPRGTGAQAARAARGAS